MKAEHLLLVGLALLALGLAAIYLFWGLSGNWGFILSLRIKKLLALVTVAIAVSVATVLFQTVSTNRILTPSIMGFDSLYVLMQTVLVAVVGVSGFAVMDAGPKFLAETVIMVAVALLLFSTLLGRLGRDINRMILTGIIIGVLFQSTAGLIGRVLDPNAYAVVQSASFVSFGRVPGDVLIWAVALGLAALLIVLVLAPRLDVLALGRPVAISLGLRYDAIRLLTLVLVAVLVAVSTALVGPVRFFGLIVAGLTHAICRDSRHIRLLPVACAIGCCLLIGGQLIFERLLGLQSTMSVVVEFAGGLFFLWLLIRGGVR